MTNSNTQKTPFQTLSKTLQKVLKDMTTTSSKIRYLDSEGFTRSQISKILEKRYQHVRNVLITPLKKST